MRWACFGSGRPDGFHLADCWWFIDIYRVPVHFSSTEPLHRPAALDEVRSYVFEALPPSTDLELAYGVRSLVGAGPWSPAAALLVGLAPLAPTVQAGEAERHRKGGGREVEKEARLDVESRQIELA